MSLKNLRDKAGAAADFAIERTPTPSIEPRRTVTGPGGVAFASMAIEEHQRKADEAIAEAQRKTNIAEEAAASARAELKGTQADLQSKIAELCLWDGASPIRLLDPHLIRRSQWANRSEAEFATKDFAELKEEIANAGGNVQPILVRPVYGTPVGSAGSESKVVYGTPPALAYEIVYGHRRHQACLDLSIPVSAQVADGMPDQALFAAMDRENRARKNLSPYEQGRMYDAAIAAGLFPSLRRLAEAVGVDHGNAVKYRQLASLPSPIVEAFPSPLDLQVRWAKPLTDAVDRDSDAVLARAREARSKRGSMDALEVFELLIAKEIPAPPKVTSIDIKGKKAASVCIHPKGRATVEFEAGALSSAKQAGLAKLVREYLNQP